MTATLTRLLTTGDLVQLLKAADPSGARVVQFRVLDETAGSDAVPIAYGEPYIEEVQLSLKDAQPTDAGDLDILRVEVMLFTPFNPTPEAGG